MNKIILAILYYFIHDHIVLPLYISLQKPNKISWKRKERIQIGQKTIDQFEFCGKK